MEGIAKESKLRERTRGDQKLNYLLATEHLDVLRPKLGNPDHCKFGNMYVLKNMYTHYCLDLYAETNLTTE